MADTWNTQLLYVVDYMWEIIKQLSAACPVSEVKSQAWSQDTLYCSLFYSSTVVAACCLPAITEYKSTCRACPHYVQRAPPHQAGYPKRDRGHGYISLSPFLFENLQLLVVCESSLGTCALASVGKSIKVCFPKHKLQMLLPRA